MEKVGFSIAGKMAEWMFEPIQRELGYLFCFNSNLQELETRLDELKATRNDVQAREDAAKRMLHTLGDRAHLWIKEADGKIVEAESVLKDKADLQKGCFSIKWCPNICLRFSLGRKGKKSSLVLVELLQSGDQLPLTGHALPMPSINMRDYIGDARDFDSRSKNMDDIIEMLRDDETMLIGICGMGGIGKTTFAKQVLQKVHDSHKHLFQIQVFTTVSSSPNYNAIQQEVAEMLGSSSLLQGVNSEIARAERLRNCFSNKKVVVLLDDVWEEFDLNAKGFSLTKSNVGCCKIIYTSRIQGLWSGQRTITKKEIGLELLSSEEAFNLFEREVSLRYDDIDFHWKNEIARQIVEECGRLPLALGAVGGALIDKDKHDWKNMLNQLRKQVPDQHTEKINKVLETSYLFLKDPNARFLFLLCCLFGEDQIILVETLYRYAVSLQHFKDINNLSEIRDCVYSSVNDLIRRNLLIKFEYLGREKLAVKMHDLVRDMAILIAEKEENGIHFLKWEGENELMNIISPYTKMISILSQEKSLQVLDTMKFRGSKLELLRLNTSGQSNIKVSGNYLFEGEDNFKVLDIPFRSIISEFPLFSPLTKLKMLSLDGMSSMNMIISVDVSSIGHIKCLEILCLQDSNIRVLPKEISELTNLKLLDLTRCRCFISNGVLLKLTNLQELYMWDSFQDWRLPTEDVNGGENYAAGLDELNCLHRLWRLELEIPNIEQVPRGVRLFSSSLEQFNIRIGGGKKYIRYESGERKLWLKNVRNNTNFLFELGVLVEKCITNLYLCVDSGMWENMSTNKFLSLKYIELKQCVSLFPQSPSSLQTSELGRCLRSIKLYECNEMTHLCSALISRNLTNLQVLVLQQCEMTKEVVSLCDETEQLNKIEFNALKTLVLRDLSRLECFCKGINEVHFQNLRTLELNGLKQFIFPAKLEIPCLEKLSMISLSNVETLCMPLSLQNLKIDSCDNFQYVDFSHHLGISHLKSLIIKRCKMLEGVVGVTSSSAGEQRIKSIEFPNLSTLKLKSLDKLANFVIDVNKEVKSQSALFYQNDYQVSFPCLKDLSINELPKINYIIGRDSGQVRENHDDIQPHILFPNLERLLLSDLEELVSFVAVMDNMDNNCKNKNALFHPEDNEVFPSLNDLVINKLSKINYIEGWKEGGKPGERHRQHDKTFPVLTGLKMSLLTNLIHIYEINQEGIGMLLFQNLKKLDISKCEKLRYLFSENIRRTTAKQLNKLIISNCGMMEVVVKKEEELIIEDDDDKEGGSNSLKNSHFFPLLWIVVLLNLSSLRSFIDDAYTRALPSLEYLTVIKCPKLNALSSGFLDSPRLDFLRYYNNNYREAVTVNVKYTWKGDVNSALRHLFIIKEEDVEEESEDVEEESEDYIESEDSIEE